MPQLSVVLLGRDGIPRIGTCELPAAFAGAGAVTIHFGDWYPLTFHVHTTPQPMDRRKGERRTSDDPTRP